MVNIINNYFDNKYKIKWKKVKFTGDAKRVMSINKLKKLGFKMKFDLKDSIFKTIDWYKENKKNSFKRYSVF